MSFSRKYRQTGSRMVRLDGGPTAWLDFLNKEDRWGIARSDTEADDGVEWLDEDSDFDNPDEKALPEVFDPLETIDPQWLAQWEEFKESLGDGDQADEG